LTRALLLLAGTTLWVSCALAQTAPATLPSVSLPVLPTALLPVEPQVRDETDAQRAPQQIHLLPHFAITIRMRDAVRSVVVGDPSLFWADHKDADASLVIVHVRTEQPAQTNLEITTTSGQQAILWLISDPQWHGPIDFALHYDTPSPRPAAGSFWRNESAMPPMLVAETVRMGDPDPEADPIDSASGTSIPVRPNQKPQSSPPTENDGHLDQLLAKQEKAPLPVLYGQHPGSMESEPHLQAGVSQVIDEGGTVVVLFAILNPAAHAVALLPPQVQLGGQVKKKWTTAEQLPIVQYKLDRLRLGPGERGNGVVVFERPSFKQSNESLFLQMADSGAVDKPALAPIGFGVSSQKGGNAYAGPSER
jgi:hypothetical protein